MFSNFQMSLLANTRKFLITTPIRYHNSYWKTVFPFFPASGALFGYTLCKSLGGDYCIGGAIECSLPLVFIGCVYAFVPPALTLGIVSGTCLQLWVDNKN